MDLTLTCVEFVDDSHFSDATGATTGGGRRAARTETIYEELRAYEGVAVDFRIPEDAVLPFGGRGIGVHWLVTVQLRSTTGGRGAALVDVVDGVGSTI